jgi:hypothetical protein
MLFRENALFYIVLSTKNFLLLSLANYRLQSTNYCKEMLNSVGFEGEKMTVLKVEKVSEKS